MKDKLAVVTGGGGFIGGSLVADLRRQGYTKIRSVDIKPLEEWYQRFDDVENLSLIKYFIELWRWLDQFLVDRIAVFFAFFSKRLKRADVFSSIRDVGAALGFMKFQIQFTFFGGGNPIMHSLQRDVILLSQC